MSVLSGQTQAVKDARRERAFSGSGGEPPSFPRLLDSAPADCWFMIP